VQVARYTKGNHALIPRGYDRCIFVRSLHPRGAGEGGGGLAFRLEEGEERRLQLDFTSSRISQNYDLYSSTKSFGTTRILCNRCDSARCNSFLINSREIPSPISEKVKSREPASCIRPICRINSPLASLRIRLPRCVCSCSICSWTALFCRSREDVYRGGFRHPPLTAPSFLNRDIHRYTHSCTSTMSSSYMDEKHECTGCWKIAKLNFISTELVYARD